VTGLTRRGLLTAGVLAGVAGLAGCSPAPQRSLVLGCGEPGGSYLQFGELLSTVARDAGGVQITALATEGSVENLTLLDDGRIDLALSLADSAAAARRQDVVAIGRVYQNYLQCIVRATDGPTAVSDLSDRIVSLGAAGSGAAATARRLLDAAGLTSAQRPPVTIERPFRDAVLDLEQGRIDALFWSGGVPTPQIAELSARTPIRVLDTTPVLAALLRTYPDAYAATTIPAGVYGADTAVPAIGVANLLLAHPDLEDDLARRLVDVLIDDAARLVPPGSLGIQYLTPASLIDTLPVPLHAAAERRYRERYG
jgi:TRAP transporter TAXI family solute receptor